MSDVIDMANDRAERDLELALKSKRPAGPDATGRCLWCNAPVPRGVRWCDADCRDDWEHEKLLRRI